MSKKYVAAVTGLIAAEEKEFIAFLRRNGANWWHWIDNFWLIIDDNNNLTTESIRDHLMSISSAKRAIVMNLEAETEEAGWAGFAASKDREKMFKWVHGNWN